VQYVLIAGLSANVTGEFACLQGFFLPVAREEDVIAIGA
jgi:hypothetical protein